MQSRDGRRYRWAAMRFAHGWTPTQVHGNILEIYNNAACAHMNIDLLQYLVGLIESQGLAKPDAPVHAGLCGNRSLRLG